MIFLKTNKKKGGGGKGWEEGWRETGGNTDTGLKVCLLY